MVAISQQTLPNISLINVNISFAMVIRKDVELNRWYINFEWAVVYYVREKWNLMRLRLLSTKSDSETRAGFIPCL